MQFQNKHPLFQKTSIKNVIAEKLLYTPKDCAITKYIKYNIYIKFQSELKTNKYAIVSR